MKKKKSLNGFVLALVTAFIFLTGSFFWWQWASQPVSQIKPAPAEVFVIPKGEDLTAVAQRLEEQQLIRSALAFKILVLTQGLAGNVQAGDFRLRPSLALQEIALLLTRGSLDVWLTFPEGWRREEFARRLAANLEEFSSEEFLRQTKQQEGFLFPDTYLVPQEASPAATVTIFRQNFEQKFSADLKNAAGAKGLSQFQMLILASIVEREAGQDQDRPLIAGILLKRWRQGWPLQADATIQYAVGSQRCQSLDSECDYWVPVKKADLNINSAYNSYKNRGLPPTPICNPGLASIKAVIYPQTSDYWFYLSDPSGTVHYAQTNEEHNENIARYLR